MAWMRGETARQRELLEEATQVLEGRPPGRELALVLARRMGALGLAGDSAEALDLAERALPVIRQHGDALDVAVTLQMRGQARVDLGDVEGGLEDAREGLRVALEGAPAPFAVAAHVNVGDFIWFTEGPAQGQAYYESGIELAERRGARRSGDWARMQTMWTRYDLGEWDEVLATGERVIANDPEGPGAMSDQLVVLAEVYRRDVLLHRGHERSDVVETRLLPRARDIRDGQVLVPAFRVAALGRLARGDIGGALELVVEADAALRDRPGFRSWLLDWAAPVCVGAGADEVLRALIAQGIESMTRDANSLASARAALAEIEGDHAAAAERYGDAAVRWSAFPSALEHGHALWGAGRCLLALGRPGEAADRLRGARDRYASLGAEPLVGQVDALLGRATAKTS
jgi:tetratricopeptide (TPR) repeat protein